MKTILFFTFCIFVSAGCDPFDSSSSGDGEDGEGRNLEFVTVVERYGDSGLEEGEIRFFDGSGNKRVVVTSSTVLLGQTSSCGGLTSYRPNQVIRGDRLIVRYNTDNQIFERSRHVVRASRVEVYSERCITDPPDAQLTPCEIRAILDGGVCPDRLRQESEDD